MSTPLENGCDLKLEAFATATRDGSLVDEHWLCRVCHLLPGHHPTNITQGMILCDVV
jgi:hypothetical protein